MRKRRIEEIELLRGFAFLAVVLQHAIAHYYPMPETGLGDGVLLGILLLLAKFAVPLFVFITGLVLFYNYEEAVPYGKFVGKRCRDIILPYLPWAVLYAVEFQHLHLTDAASLPKLGLMLVTGKASYHLWYIVMVFQFYLAFPLLQRLVRKLGPRSVRTAALATVALGAAYFVLMHEGSGIYHAADRSHFAAFRNLFAVYLDRNAIMYFFYFVLGAFAGRYLEAWRAVLDRNRYLVWGLYAAALGWMLYKTVALFKLTPTLRIRYDLLSLLRFDMAILLILSVGAVYAFAYRVSIHGPRSGVRIINVLGAYSYIAYLAHAFVLKYTERIADALLPGYSVTLRSLLAFGLCAVLSVAAAVLLRRLAAAIRALRQRKRVPASKPSDTFAQ